MAKKSAKKEDVPAVAKIQVTKAGDVIELVGDETLYNQMVNIHGLANVKVVVEDSVADEDAPE